MLHGVLSAGLNQVVIMIMMDRSVTVLLIAEPGTSDIIARTLRIWPTLAQDYSDGAELLIADTTGDSGVESAVDSFFEVYSGSMQIGYFTTSGTAFDAIREAFENNLVMGQYLLVLKSTSYPNGYVFSNTKKYLNEHTILLGARKLIRAPFDYTMVIDDPATITDDYIMAGEIGDKSAVMHLNGVIIPVSIIEELGYLEGINSIDEFCDALPSSVELNSVRPLSLLTVIGKETN